ncbi:hypothetical protein D3C87_1065580 [compost metagenome]
MFEEAADHGAHLDVFRQARHARLQGAGAAHDQVDLHAIGRGRIQGADHGFVDQCVDFHDDAPAPARTGDLRLVADGLDDLALQAERRQPQVVQVVRLGQARQVDEDFIDFHGQVLVGRQQTEVRVELGRRRVIVAGAQVGIEAQRAFFAADDERHLGMGFQSHDAVHDLCARLFQLVGPVDIGFFVETRHQFHDDGHFLAHLRRRDQRLHQVRVHARAVDRLLDGDDGRIVGGAADEVDHRLERLVGMVQQDVVLAQRGKDVVADGFVGKAGEERREAQLWLLDVVDHFRQAHQIDGAVDTVQPALIQAELVEQELRQFWRAIARHFQAYGSAELAAHQLAFQGLAQILDFILVHPQVAVARDAELRIGNHFAPGEQVGNVCMDDGRQ